MKDLIRSFAATGVIQIANIASGVMLARILLPAGRGELAVAMLWPPVIATIGILGISEATAFHVARRHIDKGHIVVAALLVAFVLSIVLVPIGWVVVDQVTAGMGSSVRRAAILYLAFIPLNHLGLIVTAMHQGNLSIARWNVLRASVHVTFTILVLIFYLVGWGDVVGFTSASLIANAGLIGLGFALARGQGWFDGRPRVDTVRTLLGFGMKVHFSTAVAMLNERSDQLLISLLLSPVDLGLYVVAATIARGLGAIGDTLGTLVFPKVAHIDDPALRAETVGRYTRAALMISLPPVMAGIVLSHWLIVLIFGQQFGSATGVMQILLVAIVPLNVKFVLAAILKGANEALAAGTVQLAALAMSLLFLGALMPALGLKGAALAALLTQVAAALMMGGQVRRRLGVNFRDQLWPRAGDIAVVFTTLRLRPESQRGER